MVPTDRSSLYIYKSHNRIQDGRGISNVSRFLFISDSSLIIADFAPNGFGCYEARRITNRGGIVDLVVIEEDTS
jgi:hypothetical protein